MKNLFSKQSSLSQKANDQIKNKEKKLEISVYALIIIVTIALMLILFNLILRS
jgi:uncharacterized membrane protein